MFPANLSILLIEDDPEDADLFLAVLEESEVSAKVHREGLLSLGLRRLQSESFDLVFLDLSLPDSWGMKTLHRLQEASPDVPVVVMTGATMDGVAESAREEGVAACLFKHDLNAATLKGVLSEIVNERDKESE